MKALLINTPNLNMIGTNVPEFVDNTIGCYPPLGLMYIAAFAEKNTNCEIIIVDTHVENLDYVDLEERIKIENPEVVGITATTFNLIDVVLTIKSIRKVNPSIHICIGGPHANIFPLETIQLTGVDSIVLGEGEYVFAKLLNKLEKGESLNGTKNIIYQEKGRIINNSVPAQFIEDLDLLPFPARHLIPYKKYHSLLAKKNPVTTMMTSRGCPFKCIYCDRPHLGKKFRSRTAKNVVDEFEACINMGIGEIFIYDDTFTVDRERVKCICNEIVQRGLKIGWDIRTRVDTVDKEMLEKLKRAGCERIHYGIEAGTAEMIKVLKKNIDLKKAKEMFKITKDTGIKTLAYFMIGNPGETRDQIEETIRFAINLKPDYVHFSVTTPFPGTELYRMGLSQGIWKNDYWLEFSKNAAINFVPEVWNKGLAREQLNNLLKNAYKKFYLRPSYILNNLLDIGSLKELIKKISAGLKMIRH